MYTNGQPAGEVAKFIKFVLSPAGQKLVAKEGFVPLPGTKEKSKKEKQIIFRLNVIPRKTSFKNMPWRPSARGIVTCSK